jgi:excinuclease UvrABC helicase subunit UvrB
MTDKFDDLFNDFLGKNNKKKILRKDAKNKEFDAEKEEQIKGLINMLDNIEHIDSIDEQLGEPDKIETFEEDGFHFEKRVWYAFGGELVKVVMVDIPYTTIKPEKPVLEKTLDEKLAEAVENEDYEIAANIRDEIKKQKKIKKKS